MTHKETWLLRTADVAVVFVLGLFIFAPLVILGLLAVTDEWGRVFQANFTLRWLIEVPRSFRSEILHSLFVAAVTMAATLGASAVMAYAVATRKVRATILVDALVMAPLTLSYIVLGLALIVAFNRPPFYLHGTVTLLVIGHVAICLPLGYRIVHAMMEAADLELIDAAKSLGAREWTAVRRVLLPLIAPGLVASSLLAFITSLQNFSVSFMVAPDRYKTVPLAIFEHIFAETGAYTNYNLAAAVSLWLMAMILVSIWIVRVVTKQSWFENINV